MSQRDAVVISVPQIKQYHFIMQPWNAESSHQKANPLSLQRRHCRRDAEHCAVRDCKLTISCAVAERLLCVCRSPSEHRLADLDAVFNAKLVTADRNANCVRMLGSCMETCTRSKLSKKGLPSSTTISFAMHGSGSSLPALCVNGLTQDVSGQPMCIQNPAGLQLADYKVQRLQYLQGLAAKQTTSKIIQQQYYLQVACNNVWNHFPISPPSMHALVPGQWLLAYG